MALDPDDLARLYRAHAGDLLRFFVRRTLQAEVAVDLVGETFAQAFAKRARYRGHDDREALGWIYGIARLELRMYFRRGVVERRALQGLGVERAPLMEADYERIEELASLAAQRSAFAEGVASLSVEQRQVLQLRIVEERPYGQIAGALGITEQTARARVSRALRALRRAAERREGKPDYA